MINRLLYRLTANMPARLIKLDGRPYLERYYVGRLFGVTFYLHRFVSIDSERHLHNHPWGWGRALVLCGGYDEEVVTDLAPSAGPSGCAVTTRRVRFWNRVNGNHFHRIANAAPGTWTLFFHGRRVELPFESGPGYVSKGWGFLERRKCPAWRNTTGFETVYTPFTASPSGPLWLDAPKGRDVGREAL